MAFLVVAGTTIEVVEIREQEPERIGDSERAYAGPLRTMNTTTKRSWAVRSYVMTDAAYQAFRALVMYGQQVVCSGDALVDGPFTCDVNIQEAPYSREGAGFLRSVSFVMKQV